MEQLLKKSTVTLTTCALDKQEECPISGEYTLPDYCADVVVVLKCFADPRIQNRQWSGDQLLVDGQAVIRVLYLDEDRRRVHSLEFVQPFSCTFRGDGRVDNTATELTLSTKYLNCRALSPRRIEVRGAVSVKAYADGTMNKQVACGAEDTSLYTRTGEMMASIPVGSCEKILSLTESLEFDEALPPAEKLLGGECSAVVRECKLLSGKAIVKGQVYVHQLYTDCSNSEQTHCLHYVLPFSQIMDVDNAQEGMCYKAAVHVLSDTERCCVGPDGGNTILDVSVKLLIQIQVYRQQTLVLLQDAYHSGYPVVAQTEEMDACLFLGMRWETTVVPLQRPVTSGRWSEILNVTVQPHVVSEECVNGVGNIKGRMTVCVMARDIDGEVVYDEFAEDYATEYVCQGNVLRVNPTVTDVKYCVIEDKLELQVAMCVAVSEYTCGTKTMISDLHVQREAPYPKQKVTALLYYAENGESVWDIGRVCHASPTCILEENDLESENITGNMVIVVPVPN